MIGWVKLHRSVLEHWLSDEPDCLVVFIRLLAEANYEPKTKLFNGALVEVGRGQLVFGRDKFAERCGITPKRLRRIIDLMEKGQVIRRERRGRYSLISIVNYDKYQGDDRDEGQQQARKGLVRDQLTSGNGTPKGYIGATPKEVKKVNKGKEERTISGEAPEGGESIGSESILAEQACLVIFDHWRSRMNKSKQSKLTDKRRLCIEDRLKEGYDVETIKRAVDGCAKSPHHMGKNDAGTVYDDLTLICRSGDKLEQFANNIAKVEPLRASVKQKNTEQDVFNPSQQSYSEGEL